MDRPPALWDKTADTPKNLRLPNTPTNLLLKDESNKPENSPPRFPQQNVAEAPPFTRQAGTQSLEETKIINSRLSADAPEFYPSNYANPQPVSNAASSVQDRLRKHKVSELRSNVAYEGDDFVDSPDDIRLKHLIVTLTKDPGQFGDLLDIFMDTLCPYFENILVVARAAQLLVGQAIDNPSFRYTGAKLCCFIEQYCAEFRAELHLTCKKELEKSSNKSGLLLFVAELYTQLHHENIYGSYLIDAFKHLLSLGGNENVKSICQALKLTGHSLELYDRRALDDVFGRLHEVKPTITGTARSLIDSVTELRSRQWGRSSPTNSSVSSESENTYWGDIQRTVFYNTDGSTLTSEENEFLAVNLKSAEEYMLDVSDPDELCDPEPEMDEEIQAAFKDFVKLSKR